MILETRFTYPSASEINPEGHVVVGRALFDEAGNEVSRRQTTRVFRLDGAGWADLGLSAEEIAYLQGVVAAVVTGRSVWQPPA